MVVSYPSQVIERNSSTVLNRTVSELKAFISVRFL